MSPVFQRVTHRAQSDINSKLKALGWDGGVFAPSDVTGFWTAIQMNEPEARMLLGTKEPLLLAADITIHIRRVIPVHYGNTDKLRDVTLQRMIDHTEGFLDRIERIHVILLMGFFLDSDDNLEGMKKSVRHYSAATVFQLLSSGTDFSTIADAVEHDVDAELVGSL